MARAWTGPPTELAAIAALGALLRNAGVLQRSDADVTVWVAQLVALPALAFEVGAAANRPRRANRRCRPALFEPATPSLPPLSRRRWSAQASPGPSWLPCRYLAW